VDPIPWYVEHAFYLAFVPALLIVGLSGLFLRSRGTRGSGRHGAAYLAALGEPMTEIRPDLDGTVQVLRGTLQLYGEPCARYEDGGPAAAAAMECSAARTWFEPPLLPFNAQRQARDLVLAVGDTRVVVDGDLVVVVGSREHWPGVGMHLLRDEVVERIAADSGHDVRSYDDFAVLRSLADGDEVVALGRLARDRPDKSRLVGYRTAATTWRLRPFEGWGIPVAYAEAPKFRTSLRRFLALPALAASGLVLLYAAVWVSIDNDDAVAACSLSCEQHGECQPVVERAGLGVAVACEPARVAPCERLAVCREEGRCTADGSQCIAASNDDCRASASCRELGRCTAHDGRCVVASDADCAGAQSCVEDGRCSADLDSSSSMVGRCVHGSDADCRASIGCRHNGECTLAAGVCARKTSDDCRRSEWCRRDGRCDYDTSLQHCVAMADGDCRNADVCVTHGRCTALGGTCGE
jgi:hypothetical protein